MNLRQKFAQPAKEIIYQPIDLRPKAMKEDDREKKKKQEQQQREQIQAEEARRVALERERVAQNDAAFFPGFDAHQLYKMREQQLRETEKLEEKRKKHLIDGIAMNDEAFGGVADGIRVGFKHTSPDIIETKSIAANVKDKPMIRSYMARDIGPTARAMQKDEMYVRSVD
jgi:hypothetical protein